MNAPALLVHDMKAQIIEQLGQTEILLPSLIAAGLAANDRVKVRLSVLQAAARHAHDPRGAPFDLHEECRSAGLETPPLQALVDGAAAVDATRIGAPGLNRLEAAIWDDVATMIRAVEAGDAADGRRAQERLAVLRAAETAGATDTLSLA